jgi:hypothetical protein
VSQFKLQQSPPKVQTSLLERQPETQAPPEHFRAERPEQQSPLVSQRAASGEQSHAPAVQLAEQQSLGRAQPVPAAAQAPEPVVVGPGPPAPPHEVSRSATRTRDARPARILGLGTRPPAGAGPRARGKATVTPFTGGRKQETGARWHVGCARTCL